MPAFSPVEAVLDLCSEGFQIKGANVAASVNTDGFV
jgi:hypothetical protein